MLTRLRLYRFKSFVNETIPLAPFSLLVGTNASGKSNVGDALRFLHGVGQGYSLAEILGGRYGPGGVLVWRGIRGGPPEVTFAGEATFAVEVAVRLPPGARARPGGELIYRIEVAPGGDDGPRVMAESLHHRDGYLFDSHPEDDLLIQRAEHELRVRQPRGGRYRAHGKVSAYPSARPVLPQIVRRDREPAELRHTCAAVCDELQAMRFLDLAPAAMREPSPPGETVLGDRGENLSSILKAICEDEALKAALLGWTRALSPTDARDLDFRADLTGKVLVYLKEGSGRWVSAASASDGTLRFLALAAALLGPASGRLFFFEEIDNGIHPSRMHLLLELVQQAGRGGAAQVVATTHNPALLARLAREALGDALLVHRGEGAGASRVTPVADLPGIEAALRRRDVGALLADGWLENAALFGAGGGGRRRARRTARG